LSLRTLFFDRYLLDRRRLDPGLAVGNLLEVYHPKRPADSSL
jgi:hypothetical protein